MNILKLVIKANKYNIFNLLQVNFSSKNLGIEQKTLDIVKEC